MFVDSLDDLALGAEDQRHLAASLRLEAGDPVTASDGGGRWRQCLFGDPLVAAGEIIRNAPEEPKLTVCFALIKGGKPEWVVQKLTELGIDRIVPFTAARSVVRSDPQRVDKQTSRLRRVAREAAMQSRRVRLPEVSEPQAFADVAALPGAVRCSPGGRTLTRDDVCLLVGPEGGWADDEVAALPDSLDLGPHVLRAETAALAAGALTVAIRAGILTPP